MLFRSLGITESADTGPGVSQGSVDAGIISSANIAGGIADEFSNDEENNVEYEDVNVAENEKARDEMVEKSKQMGVPVIEIGDKIIVGFDEQELKKTLKVGGKND